MLTFNNVTFSNFQLECSDVYTPTQPMVIIKSIYIVKIYIYNVKATD